MRNKRKRSRISLLMPAVCVMILLGVSAVYAQASQLTPVGSTIGATNTDDSYSTVQITDVFTHGIDFGGTVYTSMHIGTNGYVTFGQGNSGYNPSGIAGWNTGYPIVAAQFDDLDPGKGGDIYYYQNTAESYVAATFIGVYPYSSPTGYGTGTLGTSFQIILRKPADYSFENLSFQIEVRYNNTGWHKSGNISSWPTAGWSTGNQSSYGEMPYSGSPNFHLNQSNSNVGDTGVYRWDVIGGQVLAPPTVNSTAEVTSITSVSAVSGGNVSSDGGAAVTARGVVWSTSLMPTLLSHVGGSYTSDGTGTGSYTSTITGLAGNTTYYVRAYAGNSEGTAYGPQRTFVTAEAEVKSPQTITFAPLADKTYGDADFDPGAVSDSGLTISYASSDESVAVIVGGDISIVGKGTTTITASQSGNVEYLAAADVERTLTIGEKELTLAGLTAANKEYDGTRSARISYYGPLHGIVGSDEVLLETDLCSAAFLSEQPGTLKSVLVSGLYLSGADADKYYIDDIVTHAAIYPVYDYKVIVNMERHEPAGDLKEELKNGKKLVTVTLDNNKIALILSGLDEADDTNQIEIPVNTAGDHIKIVLNGQTAWDMRDKKVILAAVSPEAAYIIPAKELDASVFGEGVEPADVDIIITIARPDADMIVFVRTIAEGQGYDMKMPPLEFKIEYKYGNETVEAGSFGSFVKRRISIADGVDPQEITTAVIAGPDGSLRHVPTRIEVIDGMYHATVSSLTNSLYTLIWNRAEFSDVTGHGYEDDINEMGSRLMINGTGDNRFEPDREVTRAEISAIMVRALGLEPGTGQTPFEDVEKDSWYAGYIETAYNYGLVRGYSQETFDPLGIISREQAYVMISRAMSIAGMEFPDEMSAGSFDDTEISVWAAQDAARCFDAGIMIGSADDPVMPGKALTRAEAAHLIRKLLIVSGLI